MPTSTTQDDLIIIDEWNINPELENENIEFGNVISDWDNIIESDKIDNIESDKIDSIFWEENNLTEKNDDIIFEWEKDEINLEDNNDSEAKNDISWDLDLSDLGSDNKNDIDEDDIIEDDKLSTEEWNSFDLNEPNGEDLLIDDSTVDNWLDSNVISDEVISSDEWFDLDSETNKFIDKLNARKEKISGLILQDDEEINWLEEQIKILKDNVIEIKSKIKWLNEEDKKIDSRILLLDPETKKTTK